MITLDNYEPTKTISTSVKYTDIVLEIFTFAATANDKATNEMSANGTMHANMIATFVGHFLH